MADTVVYLQGGPCDGETRTLKPSPTPVNQIVCKDGLYVYVYPPKYHNGDVIFTYQGVAPKQGSNTAHLHSGWSALRTSLNHNMPSALRDSRRMTGEALRTIARARKVRL